MTQEQELLIRKAEGRIELARYLASQPSVTQAVVDAIAHEAYYAMLHMADAFLRGEGIIRDSHKGILAAFGEYFAKPGRVPARFHRYLIDAKDVREAADYHARSEVNLADAREHLDHAVEFLELTSKQLGKISD